MAVIWPPTLEGLASIGTQVWDARTARQLPAVGRALSLYRGLIGQCPLDDYRGITPLPRPPLLDRPDPDQARSTFVGNHVEDYLLHGNAAHLVTVRDAAGWPAAARWFPASWWSIVYLPSSGETQYWLAGARVPNRDVVHVPRGADPLSPVRGVGVVEQHLRALDRAGLQEEYERAALSGGGVPSVAVIAPQHELSDDDAAAAATKWEAKFAGPGRRPVILPNGTQVVPLSWNPTDQQLVQARQLSLLDVANMFNLDGYWVGAPQSSHTYRSAGSMYLVTLRTSLEPVLADIEDVWSAAWLPRGRRVRADRQVLLREDLATTVRTLDQAVKAGLMTLAEARAYMGLPVAPGTDEPSTTSPIATTGG